MDRPGIRLARKADRISQLAYGASVIGAAANETARIETLSKVTGHDVVVSSDVHAALGAAWPSLGSFELPGVGRPIEVYALPEDGPG